MWTDNDRPFVSALVFIYCKQNTLKPENKLTIVDHFNFKHSIGDRKFLNLYQLRRKGFKWLVFFWWGLWEDSR